MITGRLITAGRIATCENYSETTYGEDLDIDVVSGILIVMDDNNVRAAAAGMLGKEIEVHLPAPSDRASIVAFLTAEAKRFDVATEQVTSRLTLHNIHMRDRLSAQASLLRTLVAQIERGDDVSAIAAPA